MIRGAPGGAPRAVAPARRLIAAVVVLLVAVLTASAGGQNGAPTGPAPLERVDVPSLAGEWFEVARWGSPWAHRRCLANTRFVFSTLDARRLRAVRTCTTPTGVEIRDGRLAGPNDGGGALRGRFVGAVFAWLPAAWSEYWVLASGPGQQWLLVGDHARERLSVWSRTVALDEAAFAAAIAAGRAQGFDATRLTAVPQPAGAAAVLRSR